MNKPAALAAGALVVAVLLLGGAAVTFWPQLTGAPADDAPAPTSAADPAPPPVQAASADIAQSPPAVASQPEPPPQPPASAPTLPPWEDADGVVRQTLTEAFGQAAVLRLLQTDGFVQRAVATVDNLPRQASPARLWPVNPAPGRFLLRGDPTLQPQAVHADNADRYGALVGAVTALPPSQAVALYRQLYPLFQQAWRELGYPRGEFNTRLLQVLDHLLATPMPAQPLQLALTEVKGPVPSTTPWLRYEFADPALQGLSAGQRALLRTGPVHQRRLMDWLAAVRQALRA